MAVCKNVSPVHSTRCGRRQGEAGHRLRKHLLLVVSCVLLLLKAPCWSALPGAANSKSAYRWGSCHRGARGLRRHLRLALSQEQAKKIDKLPDELFYIVPRIGIHHVDDSWRAQLTQLYRLLIPARGDVLDLCSQHDSHLPGEVEYNSLSVHGMNPLELLANFRATSRITRNLNRDPLLPELEDESLDAALMAVSIQYMERPTEVLQEVLRSLRPGGVAVLSFSNRMFFRKAIAAWRDEPTMSGLAGLVKGYLKEVGFKEVTAVSGVKLPGEAAFRLGGDPFVAVVGFKDFASKSMSALEGVALLPESGTGSIW